MQHMDCNSCRRTKTLKATTKGRSWTRYLGRLWSENVAMVTTESSLKIKGRLHCWLKAQQGTCNSPCPPIRNEVSFLTHVMGLAHRKGSFTERGMGHTQKGTAQGRCWLLPPAVTHNLLRTARKTSLHQSRCWERLANKEHTYSSALGQAPCIACNSLHCLASSVHMHKCNQVIRERP
jgi:hypothetical protein